jgi:broad specificity phosphatase PhoE
MSLDDKADEGGNDSLSTLSDFPFFVIRHSERIDEVNPTEWEELVQRTFGSDATDGLPVLAHSGKRPMPGTVPIRNPSSRAGSFSVAASSSSTASPRGTSAPLPKRNKTAFIQDPPLSNTNGQVYAEQAAETIGSTLLPSILSSPSSASSSSTVPIRIYSSRFLRAVQTAMPLALKLHLPIHISFGLSTVLPQVAKAKDLNQFLSLDDLHVQFPSVSFISCDDLSHTETYLPTSGWIDSVHSIVRRSKERNELAIIVGHRETVRGLAGRYLTTPYCTIAMFDRKRLDIVVEDSLENEEQDDSKHEANLKEAEERQAPLSMKNLKSAVTSSSLGMKAVRPNVKVTAKTSLEPTKKSSRQREGPIYELVKLYDCRGNILNISEES